MKKLPLIPALALVLMGATLSSCTLLNEASSGGTEQVLAAAGFQPRPADTPAKQASLAAMKPYQISMHSKGGAVYYTYADPKQGILYIGGPAQYAAYQKMTLQQEIASENEMAAVEQESAAMDWSMWGPGPWGW